MYDFTLRLVAICISSFDHKENFMLLIIYHPQGGESTAEEMCLSFIYYYPAAPIIYCLSSPNTNQYLDWFTKYAP